MKNNYTSFFRTSISSVKLMFTFLLITFFAMQTHAQVPTITVGFTSEVMTVDGIGDEACWAGASSQDITKAFVGETSDNSATWKAVHDGNFIYVLVSVIDGDNQAVDIPEYWTLDGVEVFFDTEPDSGDGAGIADGAVSCTQFSVIARNEAFSFDLGQNAHVALTGTNYIAEYRIALNTLIDDNGNSPVLDGTTKIGFDINVNDKDGGAGRQRIVWVNDGTIDEAYLDMDPSGMIVFEKPTSTLVLEPISNITVLEDVATSVNVYATDIQDGDITFTLSNAPSFVTLTAKANRGEAILEISDQSIAGSYADVVVSAKNETTGDISNKNISIRIKSKTRTATIAFTTDSPTIDGVADDAGWVGITAQNIDIAFVGETTENTATWKAVHDNNFIYVLVSVTDNDNQAGDIPEYWTLDGVEIYFDAEPDSDDGAGVGDNDFSCTQFSVIARNEAFDFDLGQNAQVALTGTNYVAEYRIALNTLKDNDGKNPVIDGSTPMGFDVTVIDKDGDGARQRIVWSNDGTDDEAYLNMDPSGMIVFEDGTLASKTIDYSDLKVYPNPIKNGVFTVGLSQEMSNISIEISDLSGKSVYNNQYSGSKSSLNVSTDMDSGIYILKISSDNYSIIKKIIAK